MWWGQGIGPLRSNVSRFLVRHMANQADAITVRDEKSAELLKVVGAKGSIETVADPAFALTPKPWQEIHSQTGQGVRATDYALGGDHLIFAVRTWKNNDFLERVGCDESLGQQMKAAADSSAVADFRMHPSEEAALPGSVSSSPIWRWDQGDASIEQVINVFATAKMVVAMRLHALIFAARCGVPFVALSYDPKVDALASACGQEDALLNVNDTSLTRDRLLETITRVRDTDTQRRVTLNEFAMVQGERARRPAAVAANLLS
ncbi:MAG: polysaccharide pyruvyl transferase family protein [Akkermansiaceae bacterium]|nr:polysaccharide pyruvyl transferase family protein [Armatimonadota bacterium]